MQAEREASSSTVVGVGVAIVIVMAVVMTVLGAMILQGKFVADSTRMISNTSRHWPEAEGTTAAGTRRHGTWVSRHSYCVA